MASFYFDTGIDQFITKQHNSKDQEKQVDALIQSICYYSGIDLYSGFKSVWAAGRYLERIRLGSKLLKEVIEMADFITVTNNLDEHQLNNLVVEAEKNISKTVDDALEKELPLRLVPNNMIGYAGEMVVNDLNGRYTNKEKAQHARDCLNREALQQTLFEKIKGEATAKKKAQMYFFHSCLSKFFLIFLETKLDINLSRLILQYSSIQKGTEKNKKQGSNGEEKRLIDPNKDIADAELTHFAIFGTWINDKLVPVQAITFDNPIEVRNRLRALKSIAVWFVAHKKPNFKFQYGKVLCVDKDSFDISVITVEELELEPWVHESSSNDARTWLNHEKESLTT